MSLLNCWSNTVKPQTTAELFICQASCTHKQLCAGIKLLLTHPTSFQGCIFFCCLSQEPCIISHPRPDLLLIPVIRIHPLQLRYDLELTQFGYLPAMQLQFLSALRHTVKVDFWMWITKALSWNLIKFSRWSGQRSRMLGFVNVLFNAYNDVKVFIPFFSSFPYLITLQNYLGVNSVFSSCLIAEELVYVEFT